MLGRMNLLAWQRTCRHNPPPNDVASTRPEDFNGIVFPDEALLSVMLAARRFGVGLPLWPETTEAQRAARS